MRTGFYKLDGILLYAPNSVHSQFYTLSKEDHHTYSYPVDGWYWFDSELDAHTFFNIPLTDVQITPDYHLGIADPDTPVNNP